MDIANMRQIITHSSTIFSVYVNALLLSYMTEIESNLRTLCRWYYQGLQTREAEHTARAEGHHSGSDSLVTRADCGHSGKTPVQRLSPSFPLYYSSSQPGTCPPCAGHSRHCGWYSAVRFDESPRWNDAAALTAYQSPPLLRLLGNWSSPKA